MCDVSIFHVHDTLLPKGPNLLVGVKIEDTALLVSVVLFLIILSQNVLKQFTGDLCPKN